MSTNEELDHKNTNPPQVENDIHPVEENIVSAQVETLDLKPEPLAMEVHHHGHVHEEKKWKEYLFQFLMLFLAVFCGFFAEYRLEHTIEKEKGKQYVKSLYEDLHGDTALLAIGLKRANAVADRLDSAIQILQSENLNAAFIKQLYLLNLGYLNALNLKLTDRTASQLKNAGGMRVIDNIAVVNTIINYWSNEGVINAVEEDLREKRGQAREKSYSIFDSKYYSSDQANNRSTLIGVPTLMITDYNVLAEFSNRLSHLKNLITNVYIPALNNQVKAGNDMMKLIKEKYDY